MDKIEKIRQEIERRINILTNVYDEQMERKDEEMMTYYHGKVIALEELLSFLDTLSEEPCKSLEEEISRTYHDGSVTDTEDIDHVAYENIAHHFAQWGAEHLRDTTKMIDKSLEEAAEEYAKQYAKETKPKDADGEIWKVGDVIIENQMSFEDGFIAGAEWQKSQMLKDAMEGYVNYYEDSGGILMAEAQVGCPYHNGDKVRIVVLKAEEE